MTKKLLCTLWFIFLSHLLVSAQDFNLTFRSEITYPYSCSSIWGYVDSLGNEYALVGTYDGVSIVDVTDPDNPEIKFSVPHSQNLWREIKTYGHYAYATNEVGGGLLIIDLGNLPQSVSQTSFTYTDANGNTQSNGHTLWIDEFGKLYIFGGLYGVGGATIFDLAADPLNPPFLGKYEQQYIHDGFVRGDTLWAGEIYAGKLAIIDVSNPANPVTLATVTTPSAFTHNAWPTHDNHYVFTTDEVDNSYLTSYDVSDLSNITELDRAQSNPGSGAIIHNVHLLNDQFACVAYYKDGVTLFDVSHPDNMIQVGAYDTDPQESGGGYGGTWGVYPYLPSGNIIASDLYTFNTDGKLTVLTPAYVAASWLEGNVTNASTGATINNVLVEILSTQQSDLTDLGGDYKTGSGVPGTYTVRFSKDQYVTKQIQNVELNSGVTTTLNVQLNPLAVTSISGSVSDSATNQLIPNAHVHLTSLNIGATYDLTTDANGFFSLSGIYEDTYNIYSGKWGYRESAVLNTDVNQNSGAINMTIANGAYYDDFIVNNGWTVNSTASTGIWERGEPIGTSSGGVNYNPEYDVTNDYGDFCYVTGNGGGSAGFDDVDNGTTTLTSPVMDLSGYDNPIISFYSWFANGAGSGTPNDTLTVYLTNGTTTVKVADIKNPMSQWVYHEYPVADFLSPNATMKVSFTTGDLSTSGHVVEAAVDKFNVYNAVSTAVDNVSSGYPACNVFPNPFSSTGSIIFDLGNQSFQNAAIDVYSVIGQLQASYEINGSSGQITWGDNLPSGMYIVKLLVNGSAIAETKVVKTQ